MDIQYIREFICLAEIESYADAAEKMFISQSSLFKHIKSIENELGVELFEKKGKHISLGPFGKVYLEYAKKIVELDSGSKKKIQSKLEIHEQRIRIWTNYSIGDLAVRFYRSHEEYLLDIREGDYAPKQISAMAESRNFDLYFLTDVSMVMDSLICMPYIKDNVILAVSNHHPLAKYSEIALKDLEDENFILFHDYGTKDGQLNPHNWIFKEQNFLPKSNLKLSRSSEIIKAVQKNAGIAVLSERLMKNGNYEGITLLKLEDAPEYHVWCCYHKDMELSHGASILLDFCRTENAL
ncbi:MAG: LysR family transcriptional regulator [Lachnospiraceae bacterium]|nr:LysR family transcriptional regulator [Lachnospiraceae bacterium]